MIIHAQIDGQRYTFNTEDTRLVIGEGGEAIVMRWNPPADFVAKHGRRNYLAKLYFETGANADETARMKANKAIRQQKLRAVPQGLPANAITPTTLIFNASGEIIGYVMPRVEDVVPLIRLMDKGFREANGITQQHAVRVLTNLHKLLTGVHKAGVVVGDFNDKNVLVSIRTGEVYLIDVDSGQWGTWPSLVALPDFADPTLLSPSFDIKDGASYSETSDWYSFTVMVYQLLTLTNPYRDGVHRPKANANGTRGVRYNFPDRVTHRITVFDSSVRLPNGVHRPASLPDMLGRFMREIFTKDRRVSRFPLQLLTTFVWMECPMCRREHGRTKCPKCGAQGITSPRITVPRNAPATAPASRPAGTVPPPAPSGPATTGPRTAAKVDVTYLAAATSPGGQLQHVHYTGGAYRREDGSIIWRRTYVPQMTAVLAGDRTVFAAENTFAVCTGSGQGATRTTQQVFGKTTVAANSRYVYWVDGNSLVRDDPQQGRVTIGEISPQMTSVWVGESFGVSLVQAGFITWVRTFDATNPGLTGSYYLPPSVHAVVDAHCVINDTYAWLVVVYDTGNGKKTYKCFVLDAKAQPVASAQAASSDNTWLGSISRSALAIGDSLLVPMTGIGIVRIAIKGHALTSSVVSRGAVTVTDERNVVGLCFTNDALMHVGRKAITAIPTSGARN